MQISAHKRTVDDLTAENSRAHMAFSDVEARMAALERSTDLEKNTAAQAAENLRVERDTLQSRLEQVSVHIDRAAIPVEKIYTAADAP